MTRSGCTARVPRLTVVPKSDDRVMRFRAESTAVIPGLEIKQSAIGVPYDADPTRLPGPPWYASAAGSRARGLGAGYSAGRSACPLPRLSPHYIWHRVPAGTRCRSVTLTSRSPGVLCVSLVTGAAPGLNARIAAVSPTFGRLYEGTYRCSRGQTWPARPPARPLSFTAVTPATGPPNNLSERPSQCCRTVGVSQENC
jgi:hypothetical protein